MDIKIREKIISEYKSGKSSLDIVNIVGLSKPTILKILREENLIRKRDRCSKLDIKKEGEFYYTERTCKRCNQIIKTKSKDKVICCRNHYKKINNDILCKPCSLELQKGNGNPFYGKKHNEETIKKISKSRKGKGTGDSNSMANPEWRKKASENLKKRWDSGELENTRKIMSEHLKNTRRKGKLKSVIVSKKEKEIVKFLRKLGLYVIPSFRVDTKICDVFIPSLNLIIEYNGDYWHCNPKKYESDYYNQKKGMTAQQIWNQDKMKVDLINEYGYNLEVIWESDLKHNNQKLLEILKNYDSKNNFTPERS